MSKTIQIGKWSIPVIAPLLIILAAGVVLLICFAGRSKEEPALHVTGIIDGREVNLAPKVAGRIATLCCNEGDLVKEGQTVITLESEDIKASVEQAAAGVARAGADIKAAEANIVGADADAKSAAADLDRAGAQMEESKREAERAKELFKKEFISRESRDQSVTAAEVNIAAYYSLKEKLNSAHSKKAAAVSQLQSSKAMLKDAEANLAFYRSKLADTVITTPVTGTVIFKALEKGETVSPGVTILTIVDLGSLYARVDIDETKVGGVVLNSPALVTVEGIPGKVFKGTISEIGRYAEFATQRDVVRGREDIKTFRVKISVDDAGGILKPGMTVDVTIPRKM